MQADQSAEGASDEDRGIRPGFERGSGAAPGDRQHSALRVSAGDSSQAIENADQSLGVRPLSESCAAIINWIGL